MDVSTLLEEWGFPELVDIFKENDINTDAFEILTKDEIKELIPKVGPRALFLRKYALYKAPISFENINERTTEYLDTPTSSELGDTSYNVTFRDADLGLSEKDREKTPASLDKKEYQRECAKKIKLQELLDNCNDGKIINKYYGTNSKLNDSFRDKLVSLLIDNEIKDDIDKRISIERYELLANAVVGLFPSEVKEMYFSQSLSKQSVGKWRKVGTGKLFRRFYNRRRQLQKCGLLQKKSTQFQQPSTSQMMLCDGEDDDEIIWLRNCVEPWTEVVTRWRQSYDSRTCYRDTTIQEYMAMFPCLKSQLGYTLLEDDFSKMYPEAELKLFSNFQTFSNKILEYAKKMNLKLIKDFITVFDDDNLSIEAYNTHILLLLPLILKPVFIKKNKGSGAWKPSRLEVSEGFILHVKIVGDIKPALERKRNKLATYGLTLQPLPIIVGQNLQEVSQCFVAIDSELYQVATAIKAVDACFKVIHTLNASYANESEQVWTLVQKGLFNLNTPFDKSFQEVEKILQFLRE